VSGLVKYNAARRALAEAHRVDEVKSIRDKAVAMQEYARQAKDTELIGYATEIRLRAERKAGELLAKMDKPSGGQVSGKKKKIDGRRSTPSNRPPTLSDLGITKTQSSKWQRLADLKQDDFEAKVERAKKKSLSAIDGTAKRDRAELRAANVADLAAAQKNITEKMRESIQSVCDLRVCSCADLLASGIKPDAVITDPPYPQEFLPVFTELAIGCAKAGIPLVAVMSGQSYLPDVMKRLCEHLKYRWMLAYMLPGGGTQVWPAKANNFWKPVILFGESFEWFGDVATSTYSDKRFHGWGQSEAGMADLVARLTKPGQLICDPFLGGGTTAIVSLALGRRFVGCDIDASCVELARQRVEATNVAELVA
jgi:site-specific DNA-methyltransferase (adenine-specific)